MEDVRFDAVADPFARLRQKWHEQLGHGLRLLLRVCVLCDARQNRQLQVGKLRHA